MADANIYDPLSIARRTPVLLVVIHVTGWEQAMRNAAIAKNNGADGVFLIDHHDAYNPAQLIMLARDIKQCHDLWVGVNFHGMDIDLQHQVNLTSSNCIDAVWADYPFNGDYDYPAIPPLGRLFGGCSDRPMIFGGVAFKGCPPVADPPELARRTMSYLDVITTSGARTGAPADVARVEAMKNAIKKHPLGLASGVDSVNVIDYLPFVSYFLVASSLGVSFTELDPDRVRELADIIHASRS